MIQIGDKRAAQRAKKAKRATDGNGYIEGAKATGWKQAINQLSVAYPAASPTIRQPAHTQKSDTLE